MTDPILVMALLALSAFGLFLTAVLVTLALD